MRSNDKSTDFSTINNTTQIKKNSGIKHSIISKNTSASTLHFKKQISPLIEKISKNNAFTPLLTERSDLIHLQSTEMSLTNNSIRGSFINNDVFFTKLQEENKKCIDFTSKIIDSMSKLKSFLTLSGKEYNQFIDRIKRKNSFTNGNLGALYNYIDIINDCAYELKGSFSNLNTINNDNDITYDSTKINKNNIKLSSERRLNIYKKLFDICKDSFFEIKEILLALFSCEEYVIIMENNNSIKNTVILDTMESSTEKSSRNNYNHFMPNTVRDQLRNENNLLRLENDNLEYISENIFSNEEKNKRSFYEETDLNDEEITTLNENVNIKIVPSEITYVKKPKDSNIKLKCSSSCYEIKYNLCSFKDDNMNDIIVEDSNDGDTIKEYVSSNLTKNHRRARSLDLSNKLLTKSIRQK